MGWMRWILRIRMILLSIVCLIEYEQVNLLHSNEGVDQALVKNFCGADNNHVVIQVLVPCFLF
jgi:hypothetical protein